MRLGLALSCALTTACGFSSPKLGSDQPDAPILGDGCTSRSAQVDTCPLPGGYALMLSGTLLFDNETGVLKDTLTNIERPVVSMPLATLGGDVRGDGDSDNGVSTGGAGGKAAAAPPAGPLGGCAGGKGGKGDSVQNDGGAGGLGGGAAYLLSAVSIVIASGAGIDAGGDGGGGGKRVTDLTNDDAGAGGGGEGGSIFLEAPAIRSAGTLAANGGGGEGSGGTNLGRPGAPGTFGIMVAAGGQGGATNGADGADGGYVTTAAGQTPNQLRSGGEGGGGSVGFIRVESADAQLGANVSLAATPL